MTTNIVATITGNGAALTAELNKTFGAIPSMARRVGDQVGDLFGDGIKKGTDELRVAVKASERSIQEIRANIRNTNGAIQFDSSGIKSTIAARQQELQAIEALERALSRKAAKESDATRETQVYLATLRATVDEERQAIAALTSKAQVLDNLQAETGQAAVQQARLNATTRQARAGMQQLGFQISDVSQSFASGVSPMVIFGQQASQVVQAVGMMTNKTSGLIGFLVGPWGAAMTAAVTVLGTLYFAHNKAGDGADGQGKKEKSLTERIEEQNKSLRQNIQLQGQKLRGDVSMAENDADLAQKEVDKIQQRIVVTKKRLADVESRAAASPGRGGEAALGQAAAERSRLAVLQQQLKTAQAVKAEAEQNVRVANIAVIDRRIAGQFDKSTAETNRYEDALGKLRQQVEKNEITDAAYEKGAAALLKQHEANKEAIEASTKALRENNLESQNLPKVTGQEVAKLLGAPITSGKRTAAQNAAAGGGANSYHLTGQAIDIPLTVNGKPLTKESIRALLEPAGVVIKELLGPGDKGHSDHFHIAFDRKRAASDKMAKEAQDELAASLKNVIDLFNPAEQAAAQYRLQLQEIKNLETAGIGQGGISGIDATRYRDAALEGYGDKLAEIENKRHSDIISHMFKEFQLAVSNEEDAAAKMVSDYLNKWQLVEQKKVEIAQDTAEKEKKQMEDLASFYQRAFQSGGQSIWSDFTRLGKQALAELAAQSTIKLLGGNSAAGGGGVLGGLMGNGVNAVANLFGLNKTKAAQQGGSGGTPAPDVGAASGLLNKVKIPGIGGLGDVAGAAMLAYSLFGGALKSTKKGSATLGFSNGELGIGATSGNSGSRISAAKSGITAVGDLLNQIAEGVGGTITGAGSVSLGMRKKNYVVDTSGRGRTKGSGVLSFKDEQSAIEAAVRDALRDGVINGISAASQSIIASGQDLQKAIQKAVMIESIPKALKARMNPVGAALEELNAKWDKTIGALKEGGASAAQMADAEKLYRLEREDAMKAANDNLKEFINSLNFGGASTYSLMDQSQMARADLEKYLGNINAGNFGAVDQQKYLASAQEFLNIQRELNGSGTGWFNSVDELRNATQKLADGLEKGTADAATRDPFAQETASNTQATAEILAQQTVQLGNIEGYLATLASGSNGASGFIGSDRNFVGLR